MPGPCSWPINRVRTPSAAPPRQHDGGEFVEIEINNGLQSCGGRGVAEIIRQAVVPGGVFGLARCCSRPLGDAASSSRRAGRRPAGALSVAHFGPGSVAARRLRGARPTGRSGASGADFGGRAWDAPRLLGRRRRKPLDLHGEPGGTRTHGPKIKSLVLYHLSYGLFRIYIKYLHRPFHPLRHAAGSGITAPAHLAPPL